MPASTSSAERYIGDGDVDADRLAVDERAELLIAGTATQREPSFTMRAQQRSFGPAGVGSQDRGSFHLNLRRGLRRCAGGPGRESLIQLDGVDLVQHAPSATATP